MDKLRVHELAKKLERPSSWVMKTLSEIGEFVKSPSSTFGRIGGAAGNRGTQPSLAPSTIPVSGGRDQSQGPGCERGAATCVVRRYVGAVAYSE
jgi:hypothetical protein